MDNKNLEILIKQLCPDDDHFMTLALVKQLTEDFEGINEFTREQNLNFIDHFKDKLTEEEKKILTQKGKILAKETITDLYISGFFNK